MARESIQKIPSNVFTSEAPPSAKRGLPIGPPSQISCPLPFCVEVKSKQGAAKLQEIVGVPNTPAPGAQAFHQRLLQDSILCRPRDN